MRHPPLYHCRAGRMLQHSPLFGSPSREHVNRGSGLTSSAHQHVRPHVPRLHSEEAGVLLPRKRHPGSARSESGLLEENMSRSLPLLRLLALSLSLSLSLALTLGRAGHSDEQKQVFLTGI